MEAVIEMDLPQCLGTPAHCLQCEGERVSFNVSRRYGLTLDLICALTSAPEVLKWTKVAIASKTNAHHILHIVNFVYVRTMASGL